MSNGNANTVIVLDLPAKYVYLPILGTCIKTILGDVAGLQQRDVVAYNVELAVYEACTNIVEHAYGNVGGRIEATVTLASSPNRLIVDLVEFGVGFDLAAVPDPDLDVPKIHGYGLYLVHELMDEVIYHPEAGQNHWRLIKYLVVSV